MKQVKSFKRKSIYLSYLGLPDPKMEPVQPLTSIDHPYDRDPSISNMENIILNKRRVIRNYKYESNNIRKI